MHLLELKSSRLILEPIHAGHAGELYELFSDPDLYRFLPLDPPSRDQLRSKFKVWERRRSPNEDELWLNWVAREIAQGQLIGHFQAGIDLKSQATVAYMIAKPFQKQGYATEGLSRMSLYLLKEMNVDQVRAWVDTRNAASIKLLERVGYERVDFIKNAAFFKGGSSDEFVYRLSEQSSLRV